MRGACGLFSRMRKEGVKGETAERGANLETVAYMMCLIMPIIVWHHGNVPLAYTPPYSGRVVYAAGDAGDNGEFSRRVALARDKRQAFF
jgi:hypothetical protein